ncbi:MAG: hypothetical protein IKO00_01630 [Oscillospiraceae bacterium]|nr:hypothetical protein [Oscillospiraceae bacterium]
MRSYIDPAFPWRLLIFQSSLSILHKGVENVIITLGERGCVYATRDCFREYPAVSFPSVDATGASDVFISCLASQLARGENMDRSIQLAILAASYSVSKEGVQNAIINSDLLYDLFNGNYSLCQIEETKRIDPNLNNRQ